MLDVHTILDEAGLAALEPEWNAIVDPDAPAGLFLSYDWMAACWAWRRLDSTLNVLVARAAGRLAGVLPLIRSRDGRRLHLLTVPDTQAADMIVAGAAAASEVAEAFCAILTADRGWDTLRLEYLMADGNAMRELVPALARRRLRSVRQEGGRNPFVRLSGGWEAYYAGRSRSLKKANNLAANRMQKAGAIRVEQFTAKTGDIAACERALGDAVAISGRSWKQDAGNALDRPGPNAFIGTLSRAAHRNGWLSLWLVYLDDRPVAMEYQLVGGGNVHALRADFDSAYKGISPGSHLFRHLLATLFARGLDRYYMGPGENLYKMKWTEEAMPLVRVIVYNRSLRGWQEWIWECGLKPKLRTLRNRLRSRRTHAF